MTTCIVLAGGNSRRMGTDKTALTFREQTFLERAVFRFKKVFDEVLVSVQKNDERFANFEVIEDIYENCGPMSGLHTALSTRTNGIFITAADMPFAEPRLALCILRMSCGWDACVINTGIPHPLFGWYSSSVLPIVEQFLQNGQCSMTKLLESVNTRYIYKEELPQFDMDKCLQNINTPSEFIKLKSIYEY